jgi:hypothetical protein
MCRSGCPTQDHKSWGECARASRFYTHGVHQRDEYKAYDAELNDYASARMQGIQPKTTRRPDIDRAVREADA